MMREARSASRSTKALMIPLFGIQLALPCAESAISSPRAPDQYVVASDPLHRSLAESAGNVFFRQFIRWIRENYRCTITFDQFTLVHEGRVVRHACRLLHVVCHNDNRNPLFELRDQFLDPCGCCWISADVGSSKSSISGPVASARAIQSRCCCPPDRLYARSCKRSFTSGHSAASLAIAPRQCPSRFSQSIPECASHRPHFHKSS